MDFIGYIETPEKRSKGIYFINPHADMLLHRLKREIFKDKDGN